MSDFPASCDPGLVCRKCLAHPRKNRGLCAGCNRAQVRDWQVANPEKRKEQGRRANAKSRVSNPCRNLWYSTKGRAIRSGLPFDLKVEDLQIPELCPVLGMPLEHKRGSTSGGWDSSPSIDRLVPELGYVRGNVHVISLRANHIKNNASFQDLTKVLNWVRRVMSHGVETPDQLYSEQLPIKVTGRNASKQRYYSQNLPKVMWGSAKARASKKEIPFSISVGDIVIPKVCPALGIELHRSNGRGGADDSPSLDRVTPELGYVPGNIVVVCSKANRIKHNASVRELELVIEWFEGHLS